MMFNFTQMLQQAVTAHHQGKLEEAEPLYRTLLETDPTNLDANNNMGVLLYTLGRFDESVIYYKKAIELKPDYAEAHNNLGSTLKKLKRFGEAEASYKKAIELKPDSSAPYLNLGNAMKDFRKFDLAEIYYKKAIELKPDYAEAHYNLGITLFEVTRLNESIACYKKAIEYKPNYIEAHDNLNLTIKLNALLFSIQQKRDSAGKTKLNFFNKFYTKLFGSDLRLPSNPFILNRKVEAELIPCLYKINTKKLDEVDPGYLRYGNGSSSDYKLFENNSPIIKNVTEDLIRIIKKAVKSDIFIIDSFFNIFQTDSGIAEHTHITDFDKKNGLIDQKFSLTYYLDVGDQNCSEPGYLKLYDPDKEILPKEGMIAIFPASRKHSAVYNGKTDRVMIGINFYSLL